MTTTDSNQSPATCQQYLEHIDGFCNESEEADITEQLEDISLTTVVSERDPPVRPITRLGFNKSFLAKQAAEIMTPQSRLHWTRQLLQRIGISAQTRAINRNLAGQDQCQDEEGDEQDITAVPITEEESLSASSSSSSCSSSLSFSSSMEDFDPRCSSGSASESDSDDDSSSCDELDLDSLDFHHDDLKLFPRAPSSLPSISFPAIARPIAITPKAPAVVLPTCTTNRAFSSLPSPLSLADTPKHSVPVLTPSRHNYNNHGYSRHALMLRKWITATLEDEYDGLSDAYGGLSSPSPDLGNTKRFILPPLTVHPRRGDIATLRDPRIMYMDRSMAALPLWTMAKTLWMYDVHTGVERRARATLESPDGFAHCDASSASDTTPSNSPTQPTGGVCLPCDSSNGPHWETSWFKRWELLIELVRLDKERTHNDADADAKNPPKFFFADREEDMDDDCVEYCQADGQSKADY